MYMEYQTKIYVWVFFKKKKKKKKPNGGMYTVF